MDSYTKEQFDRVGLQDSKQQEMLLGSTTPFLKDAWRRFTKNKGALVGLIAILVIFVFAVFGPYINQFAYNVLDKVHVNLPPRIQFLEKLGIFNGAEGSYNPYIEKGFKTSYYWFGTDVLGRDLWDRVWMGTRISFYIAMVAVGIDMVIGIGYGMISGFFGGKVDTIMQRIVEVLSGIPNLVVVTLFVLVLKPGMISIILALMITGWISMSRVVRAQVIKMKEHEFVLAAKTLGASSFILLFKELLPNIIGQIIVMTMFSIPNAIFYESFLAFIGLGLQPPLASLGVLIADGYRSMITHPHLVIFPVVVLSTLMLSFNLIADGLRDAFDPKMKGF